MTRDSRWLSSLTPVMSKNYITFRDNTRGKVQLVGTIKVDEKFVLKEVPLNNQQTDKPSILWVLCHQFKSTILSRTLPLNQDETSLNYIHPDQPGLI
jgi:hypothetical protein